MNFSEYQLAAQETAVYPKSTDLPLAYTVAGLTGEAGEVADKVKKIWRDDKSVISEDKRKQIRDELGDVLWYVSAMCSELGLSLNDVADSNIKKLKSRTQRGVIGGSGDNR